jgi:hypothetical protein
MPARRKLSRPELATVRPESVTADNCKATTTPGLLSLFRVSKVSHCSPAFDCSLSAAVLRPVLMACGKINKNLYLSIPPKMAKVINVEGNVNN